MATLTPPRDEINREILKRTACEIKQQLIELSSYNTKFSGEGKQGRARKAGSRKIALTTRRRISYVLIISPFPRSEEFRMRPRRSWGAINLFLVSIEAFVGSTYAHYLHLCRARKRRQFEMCIIQMRVAELHTCAELELKPPASADFPRYSITASL